MFGLPTVPVTVPPISANTHEYSGVPNDRPHVLTFHIPSARLRFFYRTLSDSFIYPGSPLVSLIPL